MELTYYGNSERDAHVWNKTGNLNCTRHMFTSTAGIKLYSLFRDPFFFTPAQRVLNYHVPCPISDHMLSETESARKVTARPWDRKKEKGNHFQTPKLNQF